MKRYSPAYPVLPEVQTYAERVVSEAQKVTGVESPLAVRIFQTPDRFRPSARLLRHSAAHRVAKPLDPHTELEVSIGAVLGPKDEFLWMVAHELGHVRDLDRRDKHRKGMMAGVWSTATALVGFAAALPDRFNAVAGVLIDHIEALPEWAKQAAIATSVTGIALGIFCATPIRRAADRRAEYSADRFASQHFGARTGQRVLASLMRRDIRNQARGYGKALSPTVPGFAQRIMAAHPTDQDRIDRMENVARTQPDCDERADTEVDRAAVMSRAKQRSTVYMNPQLRSEGTFQPGIRIERAPQQSASLT